MLNETNPMNKIKKMISEQPDIDRARKESMKGRIDRADHIFQFCLLLFGLGFWIVMILKMFL